ncbi:HlyD family type I secretion periplasmic adaptor subunit [Devosia psychrophila]|uniref:Membrane fusion protein (MFP) family protein n=1 Tax=Devosia psychrophila TaxID=728005 RepID=A0A0F5PZC6_9HYPH|nr:HlyD family type I secretion periplasmic adaptor subunit [Devosia psychrophila]KKC33960.1 hypothetical protein WH91_05745 [Devosia psychrophila]SFD18219.1 HlyD family secretion protein [Devosia psychrophila]
MVTTKPTPYSATPYILSGFVAIFVTFGIFGVWAATAPLDSAIVAPGIVAVESNRKLIQHLEGGIVAEIMVREGEHVEAQQVLVRLLPVQADANSAMLQSRLTTLFATQMRLESERAALVEPVFGEASTMIDPSGWPAAIKTQQEIFLERRAIRDSKISILRSRIEQFEQQITGLTVQHDAVLEQKLSLEDEIARLKSGQSSGVVSANQITAMERDGAALAGGYGQLLAQLAQARQSIIETELQIVQITQEYQEDAAVELKDTVTEINELSERLTVAEDVRDRTLIRAPQSGVVQNIKLHTAGGVLRPAETIMEIVPQDEQLIISARIRPLDIDSVAPGQMSEVKFPAFSNRSMPTIMGTVDVVSADLIYPEPGRGDPYYEARISVADVDVPDLIKGRLLPGMPADAMIITGERTLMDYLVKPISDSLDKSMREQ